MKATLALVLFLSSWRGASATIIIPADPPQQFPASQEELLLRAGALLGITQAEDGLGLQYARRDLLTGEVRRGKLSSEQARRVLGMLTRLPQDHPEEGLVLALYAYFARTGSAGDAAELERLGWAVRDASGRAMLTELGRNVLIDILLASDGTLLPRRPKEGAGTQEEDARREERRAAGMPQAAVNDPEGAFDGRARLEDFEWEAFAEAPIVEGGVQALAPAYAIDEEANTVRVLVAAPGQVRTRLNIEDEKSEAEAVREAGLSEDMLRRHGARVVRTLATDSFIALDVPLPQAQSLGLALRREGVRSRPARAYQAVSAAIQSPVTAYLGAQFLPLPGPEAFKPQLAQAGSSIDVAALRRAFGSGEGALVGVLDSGIDPDHPDFRDADGNSRIESYLDLTSDNRRPEDAGGDFIGHGTHVAGIIGGSGAASQGHFVGIAPGARLRMVKVFDKRGKTTEDVLLAGMAAMRADGARPGVDVVNLSLGGPGTPNEDPLSAAVNDAVRDGILVVASAGNRGAQGAGSMGSPGNSRYALAVGAVDQEGGVAFYSSRGPADDYSGVSVVAPGGGVDQDLLLRLLEAGVEERAGGSGFEMNASAGECIYNTGIVSARSSRDPVRSCDEVGRPGYRRMSGTSMAAPMVSALAAVLIPRLRETGIGHDPFQLRALLMETARDLEAPREAQGAGLVDGARLALAVLERLQRGLPVGNMAYALAMRMTTPDSQALERQSRYQMTSVGVLDTHAGHLINREEEMEEVLRYLRETSSPPLVT